MTTTRTPVVFIHGLCRTVADACLSWLTKQGL